MLMMFSVNSYMVEYDAQPAARPYEMYLSIFAADYQNLIENWYQVAWDVD